MTREQRLALRQLIDHLDLRPVYPDGSRPTPEAELVWLKALRELLDEDGLADADSGY